MTNKEYSIGMKDDTNTYYTKEGNTITFDFNHMENVKNIEEIKKGNNLRTFNDAVDINNDIVLAVENSVSIYYSQPENKLYSSLNEWINDTANNSTEKPNLNIHPFYLKRVGNSLDTSYVCSYISNTEKCLQFRYFWIDNVLSEKSDDVIKKTLATYVGTNDSNCTQWDFEKNGSAEKVYRCPIGNIKYDIFSTGGVGICGTSDYCVYITDSTEICGAYT